MNKRISTLMTASLLFSSAFGSAYAENKSIEAFIKGIATEIKTDGTQYLIIEDNGDGLDGTDSALGFDWASTNDTDNIKARGSQVANTVVDENELQQYLWTASITYADGLAKQQPCYIFTNVKTKKVLTVNPDYTTILTDYSNETALEAGHVEFAFEGWAVYGQNGTSSVANKQKLFLAQSCVTPSTSYPQGTILYYVGSDVKLVEPTKGYVINLYEPTENVALEDSDLNELYNGKGFSFVLEDDEIDNIFDQKVYAVKTTGVIIDASKGLSFPAGTYFLTDVVLKEGKTEVNADNIDWLKSTFIVVSSTQTVEQTKEDRELGNGYQFVEMTGEQLNKYTGTDTRYMTAGNEVSVNNACFDVVKGVSEDYPYALKLKNFRYNKPIKDNDKNHVTVPDMYINVTAHGTPAVNYLTTDIDATGYEYIFKKDQSNLVEGLDLLKTDGTATVYNIQFVSGEGENSELNKYLTFGTTNQETTGGVIAGSEWTAEGTLLADLNTPEYQFLITDVDKDNNITFTNRENGESIKAQLYEEKDGVYSIALAGEQGTINDYLKGTTVQPVTINRNTYGVTADANDKVQFNNVLIKLIPSTVDQYAGFLNVADKSVMTLAYARDNNKTSDKYYAVVTKDANGDFHFTNDNDAVSTEVYDAAQWQLNKSEYPVYIKRSYVYNEDGKLAYKANADVVAAYTYTLRYLNDGDETNYYYAGDNGEISVKTNDDWKAIIKVAKDGAVSIVPAVWAFDGADTETATAVTSLTATDANERAKVDGGMTIASDGTVSFGYRALYPVEIADNSLKSYLLSDAPVNSWTEAGHVTIQSEMSNYISMNDDNDGIVIENSEEVYYLHITDEDAVVPSFYISRGVAGAQERLFMYNPVDSVEYQVDLKFDPAYQWKENTTKVIFKEAQYIDADTLATEVKGNIEKVADEENTTDGTLGGLDRFKFQIVETEDSDGYYYIRQSDSANETSEGDAANYLASWNEKLTWSDKAGAMMFIIKEAEAPTANESVSATEVKVVALDGAINIKNAAGKNVVVSTILGQIVANEVLTSDNATISVPAGIAIVSVDGEEAVKVSVR